MVLDAQVTRPPASLPTLLRYESGRIRTLRSSWVLFGVATLTGALAYFNGASSRAAGLGAQSWTQYIGSGFPLLSMLCGIAGAIGIGQEYRHRSMSTLLSLMPDRRAVYLSKATAATAFAVGAFLAASVVALMSLVASGQLTAGPAPSPSAVVQVLVGGMGACVGTALLSVAAATLTRSLMLGVLVPIAMAYIVEPVLIVLLPARDHLDAFLPFTAARTAMGVIPPVHVMSVMAALALFSAYVAVISSTAYVRFRLAPLD